MCLCREKEGLWVFFLHLFEERNNIFLVFFNSSNIEILDKIHSPERLRPQSYWVVYSMLTLTSLWHEQINWRHWTQRKKISQGSSIWYHCQTGKNQVKVGISKRTFRHNFPDIFHLSRIFEGVLETLFFSCIVNIPNILLEKYLIISKVRGWKLLAEHSNDKISYKII